MSHRLNHAEISRRFRDQAADLTIQIASLLEGGVLSAAAFSLIAIFQMHDHIDVRIVLWLNLIVISLISFFQLCQRALLIVNAGLEVTLMLPAMALFQIIPFAILSSDGALKPEQYADDAAPMFALAKATFRQSFIETAAATLLTFGLTLWILTRPAHWPYAMAFVSVHLAMTVVSGSLLIRRERRDTAALRARFAV